MRDRRGAQLASLHLAMQAKEGDLRAPAIIGAAIASRALLGVEDPLTTALRLFAADVLRVTRDQADLAEAADRLSQAVLRDCGGSGTCIPDGLTGRTPTILILDDVPPAKEGPA